MNNEIGETSKKQQDEQSKTKSTSKSIPVNETPSPRITESTDEQLSAYQYNLFPSTIPGVLHAQNSGAIDWSLNGLIAYGCQNRVVIVDTKPSLSFRQTLHRHKHTVCLVKWSPLTNHLCLSSIDTIGMIIVWDVIESIPLTVILSSNENRLISIFHWIYLDRNRKENSNNEKVFKDNKSRIICWDLDRFNNNDLQSTRIDSDNVSSCLATNLYLLTFSPITNTVIIYDADLGEPVTKWQIEYQINHLLFNPFFQFNRCCDQSAQNILIGFKSSLKDDKIYLGLVRLDEYNIIHESSPSKEPKKINLPITTFMIQKEKSGHYDLIERLDKNKLSKHLLSINDFSNSINQSDSNYSNDNQLIQIECHKSVRNQIFLVFPREIYLIDLSLEIIITIIPIERNLSKLTKIFSCSLRNSFYALHENGNISFRLYQKKVIRENVQGNAGDNDIADDEFKQSFLNIGYVNLCHSEPIRMTKQNKIFGYSLSPFDETKVAFLLSTGRIMFKSLICQKFVENKENSAPILNQNIILPCLNDLIKPQEYKLGAFLVNDELEDESKAMDSIFYKIIVTDYISGLNSSPTVIRMSPPLTLQNVSKHKPLLAVGDTIGIVQIWLLNNNSCSLYREFCAHSYAIAGIEWADLHSLITFSYPTINSPVHNYTKHPLSALQNLTGSGSSSGKVTNELIHINIETGKLTPFRTNHITDSSPIETIRVSHLKQYLIILFKRDDPFEIWDVRSLTLLRVMSKAIGLVTAIEWSPLYNRKQVAKNTEQSDSDVSKSSLHHPAAVKENFIVTSRELYHFSIEGNIIRELARIPSDSEGGHVTITSIAWKSDQVLFGDASGTLNLWDLKRKVSRTEPTYRTSIKKVRFGPGRGNMKCLILYADFGVDIWDINDFRLCSQLKFPRDINFKIIDVDWASFDLPIFSTAEGFIFVTDNKLKTYSSSFNVGNSSFRNDFNLFGDDDEKVLNDLNSLNDLNVNFLPIEQRKRLIKHFLFRIPFTQQKNTSTEQDNEEKETEKMENDEEENFHSLENNDDNNLSVVDIKKYVENQIILAKLFSNQNDYDFWLLVSSILLGEELDSRLDMFLDNNHFRQLLQENLMLLDSTRKTYFHSCQVYKLNLNLKNFQRAVQVLLDSESFLHNKRINDLTNNNILEQQNGPQAFYIDALKACLIAALQTSNGPKSNQLMNNKSSTDEFIDNCSLTTENEDSLNQTGDGGNADSIPIAILNESRVAPVVKLVATSLIANGHIMEGVELLTIISKTSDACRYLQSSDRWLDSIWLAKSSLDGNECTEIMRRWCDHLISSKRFSDQQTALKIYLSRRQFSRVLRALNQFSEMKSFSFAIVCIGAQLIDIEANRDCLEEIYFKMANYFFGLNIDGKQEEDRKNFLDHIKQIQISDAKSTNSDIILAKCWNLFFGC